MQALREGDATRKQKDKRRANIRDYGLQHTAEIQWDLNQEAEADTIFKLIIDGDIELYIDKEEMLRYLRWV